MAGFTDFVIELQGAVPNDGKRDQGNHGLKINLAARQAKLRGQTRPLEHWARGASDGGPNGAMLEPKLTGKIIEDIRDVLRTSGNQAGLVCIAGYSKGSIYALRLGQELKDAGIPLNYVGLADLPIFPFGYPPIPTFPDMTPLNDPTVDINRADLPPRTVSPPQVRPPEITAKRRRNYYQNDGNGASVKRQPGARIVPYGWWWSSQMQFEEIHGEVLDWGNLDVGAAGAANDVLRHDEGDKRGFEKISEDLALFLLDFVL
jgi:hypothetical protein